MTKKRTFLVWRPISKAIFFKTKSSFQKTQEREIGTGRWISPETETFKSLCYAEIHYNSCQLNQCKSRRESIPVWESLGVQWTHIIHLLMAEYEISIKKAQEGIIVLSLTIFCKETFMHGQALSKKSHSEIDVQKHLCYIQHIFHLGDFSTFSASDSLPTLMIRE